MWRMSFRKTISVLAVLAFAFAQIAIAQHNAVHFDHGFEGQMAQHVDVDHGEPDKRAPSSHVCPEYLLSKTLQVAFYAEDVLSIDFSLGNDLFSPVEISFVSHATALPYNPRAPPVLSI
jgi:hypothetical protein|tara:strand:+ start:1463 stop:1819 length:357 start_codon:yes stop_codon:yes gene_type:complete